MSSDILKYTVILLCFLFWGCAGPDSNPPNVKFDLSGITEGQSTNLTASITDTEQLFSVKEKNDLKLLIERIEKDSEKKIFILTTSSEINLNSEWVITTSLIPKGIFIIICEPNKSVDIGIENGIDETLVKNVKGIMLSEFTNRNYFSGVKKGIEVLASAWEAH